MFTKDLKKIKVKDLSEIFKENIISIEYNDFLFEENNDFFDIEIEDSYIKVYKKQKNKQNIINQILQPDIINIGNKILEWEIYTKDTIIEEKIEEFLIEQIKHKNLQLLILVKY